MQSIFERMGGTYRPEGDYFVPNLALPDSGNHPIGKYGRMRRRLFEGVPPRPDRAVSRSGAPGAASADAAFR